MGRKLNIRPILIFTSKYLSDSSMNRVGVDNTKILMEKAIFSEEGLNISKDDGLIIFNENYVPVCEKISRFINLLDRENDIFLFYFCGHGYPDYENETVYLAMTDTTKQNWDTCGYNANRIIKLIKSSRIKHYIIILDCCHSGFLCSMGKEGEQDRIINIGEYEDAEGAVYIASAQADDICNQICIEEKYYIPFSYHLSNTIMGKYSTKAELLNMVDIYNIVYSKLQDMKEYTTKSMIQCKDKFSDFLLFQIGKQDNYQPQSFKFSKFFPMTKLNVLLVKTSIEHPIKQDDFGVPLGLWMLKGYLSTTGLGLNVEIYDERLELRKCGNDKVMRKKVLQQFSEVISRYDVVGISICSSEVPPALNKFKIAKEQGKITFCGGIFTTSNEEYLVNTGLIDYVVSGVGTVSLGNLLARLLQEKKQKSLGKYIINEYGIASKEYFYLYDKPWVPAQLPTMRKSMWIEILERYRSFLKN